MSVAQQNLEIARLAAERWNANDLEGVLELYATVAVMLSGPDWPEQDSWEGREALRRNFEDWRDVWESAWNTRGRASGLDGIMPFVIVLAFRGGKIATHEWFADRDVAVAAARNA